MSEGSRLANDLIWRQLEESLQQLVNCSGFQSQVIDTTAIVLPMPAENSTTVCCMKVDSSNESL